MNPEPEKLEEQNAPQDLAETDRVAAAPADEPAYPAKPAKPAEPSEEELLALGTVEIAPGLRVTMTEFRAAADPLCRYCTGGIITQLVGGKSIRRACGCATRNIKRKIREQMPQKDAVATVTKDPDKARAKVEARLATLRTEAEELESDITGRLRGLKTAVDEAQGDILLAERQRQMCADRVTAANRAIEAATVEYSKAQERRLGELEAEKQRLAVAELAATQAQANLKEAQARLARVDRDTEGARKRAENLRRRADAFAARNRDVLADPLVVNTQNAQGWQQA